jgi:hypothetical protein
MAVVVVRTSRRCKFCTHPRRMEIDAELEIRSRLNGQPDDAGVVHNWEYVKGRLLELGVENPTEDNVKSHWGNESKHSYPVTEEEAAMVAVEAGKLTEEQLAVVERVLGPDWREVTPTAEQILELQRALFPFELVDRIKAGKPLGITWDQVDRGINTSTRRSSDERAADLVSSLAGAIEMSAQTAGKAIDALAGGEADGEVVEEAEVVPAGELEAPGPSCICYPGMCPQGCEPACPRCSGG